MTPDREKKIITGLESVLRNSTSSTYQKSSFWPGLLVNLKAFVTDTIRETERDVAAELQQWFPRKFQGSASSAWLSIYGDLVKIVRRYDPKALTVEGGNPLISHSLNADIVTAVTHYITDNFVTDATKPPYERIRAMVQRATDEEINKLYLDMSTWSVVKLAAKAPLEVAKSLLVKMSSRDLNTLHEEVSREVYKHYTAETRLAKAKTAAWWLAPEELDTLLSYAVSLSAERKAPKMNGSSINVQAFASDPELQRHPVTCDKPKTHPVRMAEKLTVQQFEGELTYLTKNLLSSVAPGRSSDYLNRAATIFAEGLTRLIKGAISPF